MPFVRSSNQPAKSGVDSASIAAGLADPSAEVRFKAAREAADSPGNVPALRAALTRETDIPVREAILSALSAIATPESMDAIISCIRSENANLRTAAMDALRVSPLLGPGQLQQLLTDPDSDVRLLACDLARNMQGEEPKRLLYLLLENEPHPNVCAMAVEVLAEIGDASAIGPLARCAARFPDDPFLPFAIETVSDRLNQRRSSRD